MACQLKIILIYYLASLHRGQIYLVLCDTIARRTVRIEPKWQSSLLGPDREERGLTATR